MGLDIKLIRKIVSKVGCEGVCPLKGFYYTYNVNYKSRIKNYASCQLVTGSSISLMNQQQN